MALFRGITRLSLNDEANPIHPGSVMVQCPQGGQVEVIETIDELQAEGDEAGTDISLVIVPTACRMKNGAGSERAARTRGVVREAELCWTTWRAEVRVS